MRVVVNQITALGKITGVGTYTRHLLRALRKLAGDDQIHCFPEGIIKGACQAFTHVRPFLEQSANAPKGEGNQVLAQPGYRNRVLQYLRRTGRRVVGSIFQKACRRHDYEIYHEPNFIPFACDRPTVTTLHDLSVLLHPQFHPRDRVAFYEKHFQRSLRRSSHFLTVSDHCRQEVIRELGIPPERVTRTYNGIRHNLRVLASTEVKPVLARLGMPPRYLLYLGTIEPRKNVLTCLKAYCDLPGHLRDRWPLLLVGGWGWNSQDVKTYFHEEGRHRGVIHMGYVDEENLPYVYNGARALVFPSWYEGFGLPPVEMMACGGAVLASTAAALVETVGHKAHLVAPADRSGWREAMARVLNDEGWWQELRKGTLTVAARFSWEQCAKDTLGVYRQMSEKGLTLKPASDARLTRLAG